MMKKFICPPRVRWGSILARPEQNDEQLFDLCRGIFTDVERDGDAALRKYTLMFDNVDAGDLRVSEHEFEEADEYVPEKLKKAIRLAAANIERFHAAQVPALANVSDPAGFRCWQESRAIGSVGLYIPGGTAPLFSSVLMLAIPARLAGCGRVFITTPPRKDGTIDPVILWTARFCGVTEIYKVGGIQAIAAMVYGNGMIPRADKIFGPGNKYVTAAKRYAAMKGTAIDMPAGPSEVLVLADCSCRPDFVASDLLSQAEHGPDSQVVLVVWDKHLIDRIEIEIKRQLPLLARREIAESALKNSRVIVVANREEAVDISNFYAPEHLIVASDDYEWFIRRITDAGSVFLGNYSPESVGDYASGTNHTLPTNGFARSYSGVGLDSFQKKISFQEITPAGLEWLGPAIVEMARNEKLEAHENAVKIRLEGNGDI